MVNNVAPLKTARIKNISSEWFDREIAEKISLRYKLSKKIQIKPSQHRLGNLQRGKYDVQRTIKQKKKRYFEEKLLEDIAKPKEL